MCDAVLIIINYFTVMNYQLHLWIMNYQLQFMNYIYIYIYELHQLQFMNYIYELSIINYNYQLHLSITFIINYINYQLQLWIILQLQLSIILQLWQSTFSCISQSIQEWLNWDQKKLNNLFKYHFQIVLM